MSGPPWLVPSFVGVMLVTAAPAAAQAEAAADERIGLSFGLRAGYGIPGGKMGRLEANDSDDALLSDGVKGMVPVWLDLGYRITPHLAVGGFVQYGLGLLNEDLFEDCRDCSAAVLAFGVAAYLHGAPGRPFDPWVGLGAGYEMLVLDINLEMAGQRVGGKTTVEGVQYLILQLGGDFATASAISLGPFLALSLGKYGSMSSSVTAGSQGMFVSRDLARTQWHQWVTLGLQGQFNL